MQFTFTSHCPLSLHFFHATCLSYVSLSCDHSLSHSCNILWSYILARIKFTVRNHTLPWICTLSLSNSIIKEVLLLFFISSSLQSCSFLPILFPFLKFFTCIYLPLSFVIFFLLSLLIQFSLSLFLLFFDLSYSLPFFFGEIIKRLILLNVLSARLETESRLTLRSFTKWILLILELNAFGVAKRIGF